MSWLARLVARAEPAPPPGLILCRVERESVAAGDDALAPHAREFEIPVPADDPAPALTCVRFVVETQAYIPSVQGGSTWIASAEGRPVALATRDDDGARRVIPVPGAPADVPPSRRLNLRFAYYLANDPDRILRELLAGQRPERRIGKALRE